MGQPSNLSTTCTGRPKGSKNFARAWQDCVWGYQHRDENCEAPNQAARLWRGFAKCFPDEVREYLSGLGPLQRLTKPSGIEGIVQEMWWVLEHEKEADTTASRRCFRKWWEKSPSKFLWQLIKAEQVLDKEKQRQQSLRNRGMQRWR